MGTCCSPLNGLSLGSSRSQNSRKITSHMNEPDMSTILVASSHSASPAMYADYYRAAGCHSRAVTRVLKYIDEHLYDHLTLDELAGVACLSRYHFARLFRASTGKSPMEFVLHAKMKLAMDILANSDQKIAVTAASLGFFDQSHFTRTFRRLNGISPRTFTRMERTAQSVSA
jgi:AraC family transcriptional regulator